MKVKKFYFLQLLLTLKNIGAGAVLARKGAVTLSGGAVFMGLGMGFGIVAIGIGILYLWLMWLIYVIGARYGHRSGSESGLWSLVSGSNSDSDSVSAYGSGSGFGSEYPSFSSLGASKTSGYGYVYQSFSSIFLSTLHLVRLQYRKILVFFHHSYENAEDNFMLFKFHPLTLVISTFVLSILLRTPFSLHFDADADSDGYVSQWFEKFASKSTLQPCEPSEPSFFDSDYDGYVPQWLDKLASKLLHEPTPSQPIPIPVLPDPVVPVPVLPHPPVPVPVPVPVLPQAMQAVVNNPMDPIAPHEPALPNSPLDAPDTTSNYHNNLPPENFILQIKDLALDHQIMEIISHFHDLCKEHVDLDHVNQDTFDIVKDVVSKIMLHDITTSFFTGSDSKHFVEAIQITTRTLIAEEMADEVLDKIDDQRKEHLREKVLLSHINTHIRIIYECSLVNKDPALTLQKPASYLHFFQPNIKELPLPLLDLYTINQKLPPSS